MPRCGNFSGGDVASSRSWLEIFNDLLLGFATCVLSLFTISTALIGAASVEDVDLEADPQSEGTLSPKPVTVILLVDGSSSQEPVIEALKMAVRTVAEISSLLAPEFRLEIHVYRMPSKTDVFELQVIGPTVSGVLHEGRVALDAFMDEPQRELNIVKSHSGEVSGERTGETNTVALMDPFISHVHLPGALVEALQTVTARPKDERILFAILGDQGCHEIDKDATTLTDEERELGVGAVKLLRGACELWTNMSVWSVYTGEELPETPFRDETRAYFRSLAKAGGERGHYSDDLSNMTWAILGIIFSDLQEEEEEDE